ncbi:hypothetical protein ACLQ2R_03125 [Streptosporangium sp. DT93]|uniref:hypothetical protein n=1 Tax=Streptosporangium sp. DT93 TaxID=3393428 RepID=UPI003CF0433C
MTPDQFPPDQNRIIAALERRIADLEGLVRQTKGAPVTKASGPFFLPNSGTPDNPVGGALIYASGGDLRALTAGGQVLQIPGQGYAVADPAFPLTNATPTYTQGQVQTIVNTVDNHQTAILLLLASLRSAGHIDT